MLDKLDPTDVLEFLKDFLDEYELTENQHISTLFDALEDAAEDTKEADDEEDEGEDDEDTEAES